MDGAGPSLPDGEPRTAAPGDGQRGLASLRRLLREREPAQRCELCNRPIDPHPRHEHLLDPARRMLLCACGPCALLFPAEARQRYLRVPRRLLLLEDFVLTDGQWEQLAIPVGMAFIHTTAETGQPRAFYPSPAGPTESSLGLDGWEDIVAANPILETLVPEVEALLIDRVASRREYYLAPIDRCYELVGLIRYYWRGLSGGTEAWSRVTGFFDALRTEAQPWRSVP